MNNTPTQPTQTPLTQPNNPNLNDVNNNNDYKGVIARLVCLQGNIPNLDLLESDRKSSWIFGRQSTIDKPFGVSTPRLSGKHFRIWYKGANLFIQDTSTNGTYLNGTRLAKHENFLIRQGDVIAVGVGVEEDTLRFLVIIPNKIGEINLDSDDDVDSIHKHFIIEHGIVGQGAFATVKKAIERSTGETFAVKIISKRKLGYDTHNSVKREMDILKKLNHPYIIKLHSVFEDENYYYLVMDFVAGGDLMGLVAAQGRLSEEISKTIMYQILRAVAYVHSLNISHRDLKPDNILIAGDNPISVKLTDFGLAKGGLGDNDISDPVNPGSMLKTFCGTLAYLAPEVIIGKAMSKDKSRRKSYSALVDMWSLGCLCYVILTGHWPFSGKTHESLCASIKSGQYHDGPLKDSGVSPHARNFIESLLKTDPNQRLTASEALDHPWVASSAGYTSVPDSSILPSSLKLEEEPIEEIDSLSPLPSPVNGNKSHNSLESSVIPEFNSGLYSDMVIENKTNGAQQTSAPSGTLLTLSPLHRSIPHPKIYVPQSKKPFIIGRSPICQLQIDDTRLSKYHCAIIKKRHPVGTSFFENPAQGLDDIWLIDYSTNGCHINGKRIGKGKKALLKENDQVLFVLDRVEKNFLGFKVHIDDKVGLFIDNMSSTAPKVSKKHKLNDSLIELQDDYDTALINKSGAGNSSVAKMSIDSVYSRDQENENVKRRKIEVKDLSQSRRRAVLNSSQKPIDGQAFVSQK